jgi:hypothetical protein
VNNEQEFFEEVLFQYEHLGTRDRFSDGKHRALGRLFDHWSWRYGKIEQWFTDVLGASDRSQS